jgi:hypothetical protein
VQARLTVSLLAKADPFVIRDDLGRIIPEHVLRLHRVLEDLRPEIDRLMPWTTLSRYIQRLYQDLPPHGLSQCVAPDRHMFCTVALADPLRRDFLDLVGPVGGSLFGCWGPRRHELLRTAPMVRYQVAVSVARSLERAQVSVDAGLWSSRHASILERLIQELAPELQILNITPSVSRRVLDRLHLQPVPRARGAPSRGVGVQLAPPPHVQPRASGAVCPRPRPPSSPDPSAAIALLVAAILLARRVASPIAVAALH